MIGAAGNGFQPFAGHGSSPCHRHAQADTRIERVVHLDQSLDALDHRLAFALIGRGHQHGELVAADARRMAGFSISGVEHLAGATQQRIAGSVTPLVVGGLQPVEIGKMIVTGSGPLRSSRLSSSI